MKNFVYRLKKLNDRSGLAEVRETECEECIEKGQSMEIRFGNEVMILSPEELNIKRQTRKWMPPEYTPSNTGYWLWGFEWNPINDEY